jgi:hypothetical protein
MCQSDRSPCELVVRALVPIDLCRRLDRLANDVHRLIEQRGNRPDEPVILPDGTELPDVGLAARIVLADVESCLERVARQQQALPPYRWPQLIAQLEILTWRLAAQRDSIQG